MIRHLTAFILSLCIALPMCWCCVGMAGKAGESASCCSAKAVSHSGRHDQAPKDKNCPCARHETARDVVGTLVKTPAPDLKLVFVPAWQRVGFEITFPPTVEETGTRHDHGPPQSTVPAYMRHCALLL